MTQKKTHQPDYVLMAILGVILLFGLIMLSSASTAVAYEKFQDNYYYVKHQLFFGVIPGLALFFIASKINYRFWRRLAFPALLLAVGLLVAVFIPGLGYGFGGASRWLGIGGVIFQPAEVVKLAFLVYLASWLEKRGETGLRNFSYGLVPFVTTLGVIMLLLILQPDIGTMAIIVGISLVVYYVAGARLNHLAGLMGLGGLLLFFLIKIAPYRAARLTIFLHPELDPQGIGYHINQALLAVGSGGWFGLGLGLSRQKHLYLPEVIGDSIFAIIAEELGFVLAAFLIILFTVLVYRGINIALRAPDMFSRYLAAGIASLIGLQASLNIGAMIGFFPLTGVPLPFISYGSSSLVLLLIASGVLVNISKHIKPSGR